MAAIYGNGETQEDSQQTTHDEPWDPKHEDETPSGNDTIPKLLRLVRAFEMVANIELTVKFGLMLIKPRDANFCMGKYSHEGLQQSLQELEDAGTLQTTFFNRMTTSSVDAEYLLNIIPVPDAASLPPTVEYHIGMRTLQGGERTVRFAQNDTASFVVAAEDRIVGTLYRHYPLRVWDAMIQVSRTITSDEDAAKLKDMVSSIQTCDEAPSFYANFPTTSFTPTHIHVKRLHVRQVAPQVQLRVTEVQDLKFEAVANSEHFNLKATALPRASMIDQQRLWFECSLHMSPAQEVKPWFLEKIVDNLVAYMDDVGVGNRGPYVRKEIEEKAPVKVNFW